jgi:hypothetical protein
MKARNVLPYIISFLFVAALLASCENLIDNTNTPVSRDPNKGLAAIRISDGNTGQRTLLPSDVIFSRYTLSFASEGKETVTIFSVDKTVNVELESGSWEVTAEGYVIIQGTEYLAARGRKIIAVTAGQTTSESINITADNTGKEGVFSYDIRLSLDIENLSKALLVFESLDGEYKTELNLKEEGAEEGTLTVKPGFYLLKVQLENGYQVTGKTEVVHIYTNIETKAEYTFKSSDFTRVIPISGTVQVITHGAPQKKMDLFIYRDEGYEDLITHTEVDLSKQTWKTAIPDVYQRVYFKLGIEDETGFFFSKAAGYEDIPESGKIDITLNITIPEPHISSFLISSTETGLTGDLTGTIDETQSRIILATQEWIENIGNLKARFESTGTVTVNTAEQESGVTSQDFRTDMVYRITTEANVTKDYTVSLESPQTTGLAVIKIDTKDKQPIDSKETYIKTNIKIVDPDNAAYNVEHTDYKDEIRGRGNNTWTLPKKPYRIKFDKKISLFGYEAAKSWVLLAGYSDETLLENVIGFELGKRFNFPFTNHYVPIELFLNGSYQGSYLLTEQVQVGKGRVDIDEDDGFLVELDFYYDEEPKFKTNIVQLPVMIKSPEDLSDNSGYQFVKDAINQLEATMFSNTFPESGYRDLINIDTFVDYILIQDIVFNFEIQVPASVYMYKDADEFSKINMGPLWDFDNGFSSTGNIEYRIPWHPVRLGWFGGDIFFQRFFDDPYFRTKYKNRWNEMYSSLTSIPDFIDEMAAKLQKSYLLDDLKWGKNHAAEIPVLKNWWTERIAFLNTEINKY